MNHFYKYFSLPLTATFFSAAILFSVAFVPYLAVADGVVEQVPVKHSWSRHIERLVEHTGREVVHHLVVAAEALDKHESGKARGNLIAAQRLNYSVMQMLPALSVTEDVYNAKGKMAMGENDRFYEDLLPIYSEIDDLAVYVPKAAQKAKRHLKKSEGLARNGQTKQAMASLSKVMEVISETTVYLPVLFVEGQIKAALYGLNQPKRDIPLAKKAIANALDSLSSITEEAVVAPISK